MASFVQEQLAVIQFLSSPFAFADGTREVDVITTHGAKVFIGLNDVYKIKQAVNYGYMDFSTLEKRREVCLRELEINQPNAPTIYINVVPVTRDKTGQLAIGGEGVIVEWCVHMHRFPEENVLENLAEKGELNSELAAVLGATIAKYHHNLPPFLVLDGANRIQSIVYGLDKAFHGPALAHYQELRVEIIRVLAEKSDCLNSRGRQGFIRQCHGDLHLRNIVMLGGIPTPFDALEFDDNLATIDVLYDLAFLIIDLLFLGLNKQANIVFNRYVGSEWKLIKHGGFEVFPLFLAVRSTIRAMVNIQRAIVDPGHGEEALCQSRNYLASAIKIIQPIEPVLLSVAGLSGTGKSTLAVALAAQTGSAYGALLLRSDLERKNMLGVGEFEHLSPEAYTTQISKQVYIRLFDKAKIALEQNQSVIIDAVFTNLDERKHCSSLAKKLHVPFCGLWLQAPKELLLKRVEERIKDASDADTKIVEKQLERYMVTGNDLSEGWSTVDAAGTAERTLENALYEIKDRLD